MSSCGVRYSGNYSTRKSFERPKNPEPGKCYAKAKFPSTFDHLTKLYPVFTGKDKVNSPFIEKRKFIIQAYSKKWIKKKTKNCVTSDPEDCFVWCWDETPKSQKRILL